MNIIKTVLFILLIFSVSACDDNNNNDSQQTRTDDEIIEQGFMEADFDGDGVINPDETASQILRDFGRMDQNNDGVITADDHFGPEYMGEPVTKDERAELTCDANDDETLTHTEYTNCITETVIDIMDADHNGSITLEEVKAFKLNQEL
jgi:Ca2+-binding EF-hand superfamily protein